MTMLPRKICPTHMRAHPCHDCDRIQVEATPFAPHPPMDLEQLAANLRDRMAKASLYDDVPVSKAELGRLLAVVEASDA